MRVTEITNLKRLNNVIKYNLSKVNCVQVEGTADVISVLLWRM